MITFAMLYPLIVFDITSPSNARSYLYLTQSSNALSASSYPKDSTKLLQSISFTELLVSDSENFLITDSSIPKSNNCLSFFICFFPYNISNLSLIFNNWFMSPNFLKKSILIKISNCLEFNEVSSFMAYNTSIKSRFFF